MVWTSNVSPVARDGLANDDYYHVAACMLCVGFGCLLTVLPCYHNLHLLLL